MAKEKYSKEMLMGMYKMMLRIRAFETRAAECFTKGMLVKFFCGFFCDCVTLSIKLGNVLIVEGHTTWNGEGDHKKTRIN